MTFQRSISTVWLVAKASHMFTSTTKRLGIFLGIAAVAVTGYMGLVQGAPPVAVNLIRVGQVITTFPRNVALSVGTTTAPGNAATTTIGKLNVTLNAMDPFLGVNR